MRSTRPTASAVEVFGRPVYLDLPMTPGARVTVGAVNVRIPVLQKEISR